MNFTLPQLDLSDITTVAIDLDGTSIIYYQPDPTLSYMHPYTGKVLNALIAKGIEVVVATGRTHTNVKMVRDKVTAPFTLVPYNGAMIQIPQPDGSVITKTYPIDVAAFSCIARVLSQFDLNVNAYSPTEWYANMSPESEARKHTGTLNTYHYEPDLYKLDQYGIIKMYIVDLTHEHKRLEQVKSEFATEIGHLVEGVFSSYCSFDITGKGVTKFSTLAQYMAEKGLDAHKNLITFGDSMNDHQMLLNARYGFYMANSLEQLKKALAPVDHCFEIGYNKEMATAETLNTFFNLGIEPYDPADYPEIKL